MKTLFVWALSIGSIFYFFYYPNIPVKYNPASFVQSVPKQKATNKKTFEFKNHTIDPFATFQIKARVLSRKNYFFDNEAKLSPVDLALGWGPLSKKSVLDELTITQSNRWYRYRYQNPPPISKDQIIKHSANMHLIPETKEVERQIKKVRPGQIVQFSGYLINVSKESGWKWNSSITRNDTGDGSCEVVFVKFFDIVE